MTQSPWSAWWREVRWPIWLFVPLAVFFAFTEADLAIARALFFVAERGWIGAHNWWVEDLVHTGGRWFIRAAVLSAIVLWAASFSVGRLRALRRAAGYFALASILSVGIVGLLKVLTNVDCPWDLIPFGGQFPVVPLFADRPDALRAGHCFPAAHASSGYALIALYFAARERSRRIARFGAMLGITCGVIFGIAQQSRGAHFLSHDLWSAFIVWVVSASVYVFAFGARLHAPDAMGEPDGAMDTVCDRVDAICRGNSGRR